MSGEKGKKAAGKGRNIRAEEMEEERAKENWKGKRKAKEK